MRKRVYLYVVILIGIGTCVIGAQQDKTVSEPQSPNLMTEKSVEGKNCKSEPVGRRRRNCQNIQKKYKKGEQSVDPKTQRR